MANDPVRIVLDSNIFISSYVFGGKPESILKLIITEKVQGVTSRILISEFLDVLRKKFKVSQFDIQAIQQEVSDLFEIVYPIKNLHIVRDEPDNRVIETALEGNCDYIVTGDNDLLVLGKYKNIKIVTADEFIKSVLKG